MPGENETNVTVDGAETTQSPTLTAEPKKKRAPRQKKVTSAAVAETSPKAAKPARKPRRKRGEAAAPVGAETIASTATPAPAKAPRKARTVKPAVAKAEVSGVESDEFTDLIQLEEENKRLRKALSEKLRGENADLRKKLGLN